MKSKAGNIIDIHKQEIYPGIVCFSSAGIDRIERTNTSHNEYILPGLIDSHVHIESSMLVPSSFSRLVVPRGTIGVVTDPHEIGNVLGVKGVEYMIEDSKKTPLKCFFGAPSCVPATDFESSGAVIGVDDVGLLLDKEEVFFLSEMMNFVGVINNDENVLQKIGAAHKRHLPVDGHAPGLMGAGLKKYSGAGISTDHECFSLEEALEKIDNGMKIQIRQGSAAKNFDALAPLFKSHAESLMLCTDDSHPDELIHEGHIDKLIKLGLDKGIDLFKLIRAASVTPVEHYNIPVGLLRERDPADFIVIDHPAKFNVLETYIDGKKVFDRNDGVLFEKQKVEIVNQFVSRPVSENDLRVGIPDDVQQVKIIRCFDGELVTEGFSKKLWGNRFLVSDKDNDILKIVVVDRYQNKPVSIGFINGFGIKDGAIASSVAHDCHNIVAVGVEDKYIARAINLIMESKGGLSVSSNNDERVLPLPVGGIMSNEDGSVVAKRYSEIDRAAKKLGAVLKSPFMTLSFMSLLVIPKFKLGDKGLFDGEKFEFISLFE